MATSIHIPKPLLAAVDRKARTLKISRNRLIVRALEKELTAGFRLVPRILRKAPHSRSRDGYGGRRDARCDPSGKDLETSEEAVKLVLDTNAVSALMKGDPEIIQKLEESSKAEITVPQPVLAEIALRDRTSSEIQARRSASGRALS